MPIRQKILKTTRLTLRPFKISDAKIIQQKAGDKAIADTTLNIPHPYPNSAAEKWISTHQPKFKEGELISYAITLKKTGELIGSIALTIEKRFSHAELGYWIDKELWGHGYTTEAARALIEYGFNNFGLHKIFAEHMTKNPASGRVMKKLGMEKEGLLKEHVFKLNKYEDVVIYGILKDEWSKAKKEK